MTQAIRPPGQSAGPQDAPARGRNRPVVGILVFLALAVAAPAVLADPRHASGSFNFVLSMLVILLSAAKLAILLASGRPRILALCFHLFVYPFMGLAMLVQTTSGLYPLDNRSYDTTVVTSALLLVLLGLVAYEVGNFIGDQSKRSAETVVTDAKDWFGRRQFSPVRATALMLLGAYFILSFVRQHGLSGFFSSRDQFTTDLAGPGATVQVYDLQNKTSYLLSNIAVHVPVFIALLAVLGLRRRLSSVAFVPLLAAVVVLNVVVNNPISNSRFWFGIVAIGVGCSFLDWRSPRGVRILGLSGLGIFIFAFGMLDAFRRAQHDFSFQTPRDGYETDGSYSAFQSVINGLEFVRAYGLEHGAQMLSSIFTFVPHSVWAGKRGDTGSLIDSHYNRAASLWTELQVDFGLLGVALGMFLFGMVTARLDARLSSRSTGDLSLLLPLLGGSEIFLLRGSLQSAMGTLYPLIAFFVLASSAPRSTKPDYRHPQEPSPHVTESPPGHARAEQLRGPHGRPADGRGGDRRGAEPRGLPGGDRSRRLP